jgi:hypothetical protein
MIQKGSQRDVLSTKDQEQLEGLSSRRAVESESLGPRKCRKKDIDGAKTKVHKSGAGWAGGEHSANGRISPLTRRHHTRRIRFTTVMLPPGGITTA